MNVLACAGSGAAVGFSTAWILRHFKCRNTFLTLALGLLVTTIAFIAAWDLWIYRILDNDEPGAISLYMIATNYKATWATIVEVNRFGTWSMSSSQAAVSGVALWIVWAGEAAIIFACSFLTAKLVSDTPFCEACQSWCEKKHVGSQLRLADASLAEVDAKRIASGDFEPITRRGLRPDGDPQWIGFEMNRCEKCGETVTLTISSSRLVEKGGKVETKSKALISKALLTPEQYEQFRSAFTPLVPAEEPEPEGQETKPG